METPDTADINDHIERKLDTLPTSATNTHEALGQAQSELVHNESLYKKYIDAVSKAGNWQAEDMASIQNMFVSACHHMSDADIESVIRQFNVGLAHYAGKHQGLIDSLENIKGIHPQGIKSVVHFIQAREKLLDANPAHKYGFYVEDVLDTHYKIDLIECLFKETNGNIHIDTMNLIQIKSSEPDEMEKEKITAAHKSWIHSSVMDFERFEHEYSDGIPDGLSIETLSQNADEVEELLLDLVTHPDGFRPDGFIEKLDLGELSNKQKAWLLAKYSNILKSKVDDAVNHEIIDRDSADKIIEKLTVLEHRIRTKSKLPIDLSYIDTINSIIAVGPKIVSQETLVQHTTNKNKRKIIRVQ